MLFLFLPSRVQELNLEEKQWQLDQELRTYMNREGRQDVGRGWYLHKSLMTADTAQQQSSSLSTSEAEMPPELPLELKDARGWCSKPLLCTFSQSAQLSFYTRFPLRMMLQLNNTRKPLVLISQSHRVGNSRGCRSHTGQACASCASLPHPLSSVSSPPSRNPKDSCRSAG